MYQINFNNPVHVHFIGIGGISMSALAEILLTRHFTVSGSDAKESNLTRRLSSLGAEVVYGHNSANIDDKIDLVVYTAAVKQDNPEIVRTNELNIPLLTRAELLGQIMTNYSTAIGVSGTHGKTTTTSMVSQVLLAGNLDPTVLVGGILKNIDGNLRIGNSEQFITEACEYTNSFLSFSPTIGIILNVCEDHLDFFKDLEDIRTSFRKYAELLPKDGLLIINSDIDDLSYFTEGLDCRVVTYGSKPEFSDFSAENISYNEFACGSYDLVKGGVIIDHIDLKVTGLHNIFNSLAAIACGMELGIPMPLIKQGLSEYEGTDRRFQYKGEIGGVKIVDDYAHHPDEIRATLETAKKYPHKDIWCVFQPHTYTRTNAFLKQFAEALSLADKVVLADIYAARETNHLGISSKDLLAQLEQLGTEAYYFPSFDEIENFLLQNCVNGDLLITMGAGDVVLIGEKLLGI